MLFEDHEYTYSDQNPQVFFPPKTRPNLKRSRVVHVFAFHSTIDEKLVVIKVTARPVFLYPVVPGEFFGTLKNVPFSTKIPCGAPGQKLNRLQSY